jgi:hypothetical protein
MSAALNWAKVETHHAGPMFDMTAPLCMVLSIEDGASRPRS